MMSFHNSLIQSMWQSIRHTKPGGSVQRICVVDTAPRVRLWVEDSSGTISGGCSGGLASIIWLEYLKKNKLHRILEWRKEGKYITILFANMVSSMKMFLSVDYFYSNKKWQRSLVRLLKTWKYLLLYKLCSLQNILYLYALR